LKLVWLLFSPALTKILATRLVALLVLPNNLVVCFWFGLRGVTYHNCWA